MMAEQRALVVGISGCSSSGKTTLARLLRDIFPGTFILHEDDFYKPEEQLPIKDGLVDWDCAEAISIPDMERSLAHIRSAGTFPPDLSSKEDQNSIGACPASEERIAAARRRVKEWLSPPYAGHAIFFSSSAAPPNICLLDGFLLYSPKLMPSIMAAIDIKLFLLVSREKATRRREARDGYVTLEGFWKDPPGYVDKIVWPNYAAAHSYLFDDDSGDVERGVLDGEKVKEKYGILVPEGGNQADMPFADVLDWAVGTLMSELERILLKRE
ncbi:P-loop containing nucleoside triphosphate hydrolase protein [Podospora didyma]|uniref:P-loop containing nucleoside triphosphate hydrolase protein n=1 Tax=Podospora didyma TaxID=330526 RepID=A0AAE0U1L6_9PEZI|nr:P-loop containing nucleoside triphosphate hydrolase protein [Podospora didyma]